MAEAPAVILVPVDGSDGAGAAVAFAAALAVPLSVPIRLLFAIPEDALDVLGMPTEAAGVDQLKAYAPEQFAKLRQRRSRQVFDRARSALLGAAVDVEEVLLSGEPAAAILEHAKGADRPLLVMGSRGLSRFSEMLVGSVSHRVIHHATCPVTIVPLVP